MDAVDDIKARVSIEDVISEYVQLKRAGRNWKGLSPFGSEKTPSFMVSPEKQIWHDFSSGKGGNMFSFVMEMEGVDFKGALEILARKAGIDLDQYRRSGAGRGGPNKERLYELLELSTKFYQVQFSKHTAALEYVLKKRRFSKETALAWRLGYAPDTGDALMRYLAGKGFTEAEMKLAGVTAQRYRGPGDMFRGRLMIPLADAQGRVIGFTARILADDPNAPKYINTPQTALYDKSRHVFGLHLAKEAIRKTQFAVIAEGNLDVIASHQAGVKQVVATAGTALTEQQLKALSRFTGDIRLSFDADRAGLSATERAIPIASKVGVSLSIITIPSGKDPDELIKQDPKLWEQAVAKQQYVLDWLMARYKKLLDITSAVGKRQYSDVLLPIVRRLNDPVEQDHYLGVIAQDTEVSKAALTAKLTATPADAPKLIRQRQTPPPLTDKDAAERRKLEDHFLALTLMQRALRGQLADIMPDMFTQDQAKELAAFLLDHLDFDGQTDIEGLRNIGEYAKILVLQYEELYQDLELTELRYEATRLATRLVEIYVRNQKQTLAARLSDASESQTAELLEQVKSLDALLKRMKGGI